MPGLSSFNVPPSGFTTSFGVNNVAAAGQWTRQTPAATAGAPSGEVSDCLDLARMAPPTLRTAYNIYAVSLAWGAVLQNAGLVNTYNGDLMIEIALLVNDEVRWIAGDRQPAINQSISANGFNVANGVISADLINPIRLNARERLGLRLGVAIDTAATPPAGLQVTEGVWVGQQVSPTNTLQGVQSTISYQILDMPGHRQL